MERQRYPSDVTAEEWVILAAYIPAPLTGGCPAKWSRREIVNAILYVLRTGCQWRSLPHDFPPYTTVFEYFRRWRGSGLWEQANQALREQLRERMGRNQQPSAAIIDSQSVKTPEKGGCEALTGPRK